MARVGALVVGAHVEGDAVGAEVAVKRGRVLRLRVLGKDGRRAVRVRVLPRQRGRGQLERHPKVGVVAALEEERVVGAGRGDDVVEAVLVMPGQDVGQPARREMAKEVVRAQRREGRRKCVCACLPEAEPAALKALGEADLDGERADRKLAAVIGQRFLVAPPHGGESDSERKRGGKHVWV